MEPSAEGGQEEKPGHDESQRDAKRPPYHRRKVWKTGYGPLPARKCNVPSPQPRAILRAMAPAPLDPETQPFDSGPIVRPQIALGLMRPPEQIRAARRALILAAVAWIPLAILAALQGLAVGPTPRESLLLDPAVYGRYLVSLPLLVLAESIVLPRLSRIVRHFGESGLVIEADLPRYQELVDRCRRFVGHPAADLFLLLLAYVTTLALTDRTYPSEVSTWVAPISAEGSRALSLAGWWRMLVSQPLYVLFVAAWLWRLCVWTWLLFRLGRMRLRIVPSHPDLAGGLRFTATSVSAFALLAFAIGATSAGNVGRSILIDGRDPKDLVPQIVALVVASVILFAGPLLLLMPRLIRAGQDGAFTYDEVAKSLGKRFEARWLSPRGPWDEEALSAPDFSATTDLYSIVANVREMRFVPIDLRSILLLVAATLVPFLPLVFAILPLDELLRLLSKVVL
jgi:hypothetical protein